MGRKTRDVLKLPEGCQDIENAKVHLGEQVFASKSCQRPCLVPGSSCVSRQAYWAWVSAFVHPGCHCPPPQEDATLYG
mgnify:CR=1 FL=1